MSEHQVPDFIVALQEPGFWDHPVDEIKLVQTHISYVVIAGEFVYKFKKPVDFGFLDFTTLEKRAYYCQRELELNRRLCPDIYLDLVILSRQDGRYRLDAIGDVVEYGVKMVRMPEERMMSRVIAAGALERRHLDAVVDKLVPFYAAAAGDEAIQAFGRADAVGVNVLENFQQTESFAGGPALSREQFERIGAYARAVLADAKRFDDRIADGRIRDCHGDLYSANICLDEQVQIFDCIEFNERFRYSDVAADVAFLAMDLDYHGLDEEADYFLDRFATASADSNLLRQIGFYQCYRAYVRGKIGLFTAADPAVDAATAATCTEQAKRYFQLADRYAEERK
jgi:aminoglycoside phosphotransferase family enzyme